MPHRGKTSASSSQPGQARVLAAKRMRKYAKQEALRAEAMQRGITVEELGQVRLAEARALMAEAARSAQVDAALAADFAGRREAATSAWRRTLMRWN